MVALFPQARVVALDLETTGLSVARGDRVVEFAAVSWQDGRETGHFQTLVNPGRPIPLAAMRIHGITDAMVRDQPPAAEVLAAFLSFCEADFVVAHNSSFDAGFIRGECLRAGIAPFPQALIDTCSLARRCLPGCPSYRLETLKTVLGLGSGQEHRALQDARDCLAIFLRCVSDEVLVPRLPVPPPPLAGELTLLGEALLQGWTIHIEYEDVRGRTTARRVRPLLIDATVMQAHCLLRDDTRHFHLARIKRVWRE